MVGNTKGVGNCLIHPIKGIILISKLSTNYLTVKVNKQRRDGWSSGLDELERPDLNLATQVQGVKIKISFCNRIFMKNSRKFKI